jgi:GNAT superfamily N-acetyltransferase
MTSPSGPLEWKWQEYTISTDKSLVNLPVVHAYLSEQSYWARGISYDNLKRRIEHSLVFGVYCRGKQAGFARVVTDFAAIAYVADVFILEEYRGKGLSKLLMKAIMEHPDLQGLRRWILVTRDAHGLYSKFGFKPLESPEKYMEIVKNTFVPSAL